MSSSGTDNVIAALGQTNRVCDVSIWDPEGWRLEEILAPMQVPFPELTHLELFSNGEIPLVIPDSFLGGSAPRLQYVELNAIPFPGLPKLLLSATHLVRLRLTNIPRSGYIPPEAMVALFSVLSSLEALELDFESHQYFPDWESRSLPPPKRFILPVLKKLHFKGATEYLEDLVNFIDAPQLNYLYIYFFTQINFDAPRLAQFINRTPKLGKRDAFVQFYDFSARVELPAGSGNLEISISCSEPDRQLPSIEQVCNSSLHALSAVENLYIEHQYSGAVVGRIETIENTLWLELLLSFTAVKNLHLSRQSAPGIAAVLQELVGGRITEVLPNLQNIFVEGLESSVPLQEYIGQFAAARRQSGHPVAFSVWHKTPTQSQSAQEKLAVAKLIASCLLHFS